MRVVRELQERTGGFTEFVPLSFIPFHTLLGRTHGIEEISREDNLKHTAVFRLALGETVTNLQASWVKMGLDAATESLRWGVNDLGGTLMEESISRMAGSYHGVKLDPEQLIAAAQRGGPAAGSAGHAVPHPRAVLSALRATGARDGPQCAWPGRGRSPGARGAARRRSPARAQVLMRVAANAVCRTDLHIVEGELPSPEAPAGPGPSDRRNGRAGRRGRRVGCGRATASACRGLEAWTDAAGTAVGGARTSATRRPSPVTTSTAATRSMRSRAPTSRSAYP